MNDDSFEIARIEVDFAVPVMMTQAQQRTLHELVSAMARASTPDGHVHWLMETGSKPQWSRADRRVMGLPDDPDAPESGEPTFDNSVLHFATACRPAYPHEAEQRTPDAWFCGYGPGPTPEAKAELRDYAEWLKLPKPRTEFHEWRKAKAGAQPEPGV